MKKLFVVDAVNLLFRAYYAITPMTNSQGESTQALFGFIRSIYKLIADFSPDYFVCVFDGPDNKRSRVALYKDYKSHREAMPQDLFSQLERAMQFCDMAGIPSLCIPGVEADDTIGSVVRWMETRGVEVVICSADKDLCQLVSDKVKVLNPHKNNLLIDRKGVKELFGVRPDQMIDYLAIVGDSSDNIPGLEGFGPKTAVALLEKYDSLDKLLFCASEIGGKKGEVLANGQEIALLSRLLATIQTDVPFPKEESFFHLKAPDLDALRNFYQQMHFLSLLKELDCREASQEKNYVCVQTEEELREVVKELKEKKEVCIDTETTSLNLLLADLVGVGLGYKEGHAWYIPLNGSLSRKIVLDALSSLFSHPNIEWIGHHIKYDWHVLKRAGCDLPSIGFDTLIASYLISPHTQRHNLDELVLEKWGISKIPISSLIDKEKTIDLAPIEAVAQYCCEDVDYTLRLKKVFSSDLKEMDLLSVFKDIELPLIPVLARMEEVGVFCDVEKLQEMSKELKKQIDSLARHIYKLSGEEFNINSPKQLSEILFQKMGIKPPKKTATGLSTAIDVLESLQEEAPVIKEIILYRSLEKLRSTYTDALPGQINPRTGRIHCTFNQSVAATGRLSCQNPNLQNIPVRTEEGRRIREAFCPQKRGYSFLAADYSQIELRLLAHLSEDPELLKAFHNKEDVHAYTASLIFNVKLDEVSQEMRHLAKAVNFGVLYGQQAFGLSKLTGITFEEADLFIKTYFDRYSRVRDFLESCKESARKTGRAMTLTGRQRPIPEITSKNPQLRAAAERLAVNTPLQGTAADLIKIAMIQLDDWVYKHLQHAHMILQIHDELLFEVVDSELPKLCHQVKKTMEGVLSLKVPLVVDISIGKNWGEC
ncbi:MAG: hypothetical protein RLZZ453_500 [Chlamydiota bacterium]|jgi:DNA polymerase-1